MGGYFILFLYAIGTACLVNYVLLRTRMMVSAAYAEKARRLREKKGSPVPRKIIFIHPDLGIGGAERLVVDMALALQSSKLLHYGGGEAVEGGDDASAAQQQPPPPPPEIIITTTHHDPSRCFPETAPGGPLKVEVHGDWLARAVLGHGRVFFATLRMLICASATLWDHADADCFIVDQVAATLPFLGFLAPITPRLFYCHFPDQKCDPNRNEAGQFTGGGDPLHRLYRYVFDSVERRTMANASSILCNSRFSRGVTVATFPTLAERISETDDVLYPPVPAAGAATKEADGADVATRLQSQLRDRTVFVSINRYERKKDVALAVRAFAELLRRPGTRAWARPPMLLVCGGYDKRQREDVRYLAELESLASELLPAAEERAAVLFLKNVSAEAKAVMLEHATALLYTPSNEHFGIVPLEAMQRGRPVIAVNNGGPCETIGTDPKEAGGLLCEPTPEAFANAMAELASDKELHRRLSENGARRCKELFSFDIFSEKIQRRVCELMTDFDTKVLEMEPELHPGTEALKAKSQ